MTKLGYFVGIVLVAALIVGVVDRIVTADDDSQPTYAFRTMPVLGDVPNCLEKIEATDVELADGRHDGIVIDGLFARFAGANLVYEDGSTGLYVGTFWILEPGHPKYGEDWSTLVGCP